MIGTLLVAADYDVTGRTFPTGHMRVMPHTDMSALTLLFQRCGKPPRCFCVCALHPALSVPGHTIRSQNHSQSLTPFTRFCTLMSPPPPPLSPLLTLPCSGMILHAKGHHHKFCNKAVDCAPHDTLVLV